MKKLIFPCACGSNVGELSYKIAKKLQNDGFSDMEAVSKITAGVEFAIKNAKQSDVISLDGCGLCCSRKSLATKDILAKSIIITDMGITKGKTKVSDKLISILASRIKENL